LLQGSKMSHMWTLEHEDSSRSFTLPSDFGELKVGRHENCFVRISEDQSVSREHAVLFQRNGQVYVRDCSSKFGTFLNDSKLKPNEETLWSTGQTVRFGAVTCKYRLLKAAQNCKSSVDKMSKKELAQLCIDGTSFSNSSEPMPKRFDRKSLFVGLKLKPNILSDLILKCGGLLDEDGELWTEDEIFDAIINGTMKTTQSCKYTTVEELVIPAKEANPLSTNIKTSNANFKQFKKVQPISLPEIIGTSDMVAHQQVDNSEIETDEKWLNKENAELPIHQEYKPAKTIDQHFEIETPKQTSRRNQGADFQTDFFKNLL
jgi:FHA domain/DNA damage repair protein Nbs1